MNWWKRKKLLHKVVNNGCPSSILTLNRIGNLIAQEKSLQGEKRKFEVEIGITATGESDDSLLDGTVGSSVAGGASASAGGASVSTTTSWNPFRSRK